MSILYSHIISSVSMFYVKLLPLVIVIDVIDVTFIFFVVIFALHIILT